MENVSLGATIAISLAADNTDQAGADLVEAKISKSISGGYTYSDGSGSGQVDQIWTDTVSIAGAGDTTIVLNDGSLTDSFGDGVTLTKLKVLYIKNAVGAETITIGGAAANELDIFTAAADSIEVIGGGELFMTWPADGLTVGAANDELKIARAAGAAANVSIIIAGVN